VKSVFGTTALLALACTAISSAAQPYTLTKYDDPTFAKACYTDVSTFQAHFDGAVVVGAWGICGFSDRTQRVGPGSVLHNSGIYRIVDGTWKFYHKANGYLSVADLEEIGVPADVARRLYAAFIGGVCFRGDVPATKWYCAKQ
jgi:hypothetical protein